MANKPLDSFCAKLNSTGRIQKCELLSSSLTADFYAKLVVKAYQLRRQIDLIGWNRPKLEVLLRCLYHSFQVLHHTVFDHQGFLLGLNLCGLR